MRVSAFLIPLDLLSPSSQQFGAVGHETQIVLVEPEGSVVDFACNRNQVEQSDPKKIKLYLNRERKNNQHTQ